MPAPEQIAVMAKHYVIAAIWAECPEGTRPRATAAAHAHALKVCTAFAELAGPLLEGAVTRDGYGSHPDCGTVHPAYAAAGHDLWLTSQGHGAGFWDREPLQAGQLGERLSKLAKHFPVAAEFYRGWLYLYGGLPRG